MRQLRGSCEAGGEGGSGEQAGQHAAGAGAGRRRAAPARLVQARVLAASLTNRDVVAFLRKTQPRSADVPPAPAAGRGAFLP